MDGFRAAYAPGRVRRALGGRVCADEARLTLSRMLEPVRNPLLLLLPAALLACQSVRTTPSGGDLRPERPERVQVAIVGGGLAGLVAARELEKRGLTVHLLEATNRLGGKVATAHYNDGAGGGGLSAEYGMQ